MNEIETQVFGLLAGVILDMAKMPAQVLLLAGGCLVLCVLRRLPGGKKALCCRQSTAPAGRRL